MLSHLKMSTNLLHINHDTSQKLMHNRENCASSIRKNRCIELPMNATQDGRMQRNFISNKGLIQYKVFWYILKQDSFAPLLRHCHPDKAKTMHREFNIGGLTQIPSGNGATVPVGKSHHSSA